MQHHRQNNDNLQLRNLLWIIFIRDWLIIFVVFNHNIVENVVLLSLLSSESLLSKTLSQKIRVESSKSQVAETGLVCVLLVMVMRSN